ncbi:phosphatase 2C-like domain-containing protein [Multifurca ochricompacta]|uniref:Phosphatase 2C-like domain-containing protein n=1 Tax=Multifurca ochricompacta TaxID=376703 RepID=A0AAD4QTP7_9AGAM|nr:phosphatase 2C-like domain-containing protein [Multifurca ochricompacta]
MAFRLFRTWRPPHPSHLLSRQAFYHDYVRCATPGGTVRIPLSSPKVIGIANSRGERAYQEDFYSFATLSLNPEELRLTVSTHLGIDWDPETVGHPFSRQAVFVGIYDGHGGSTVSQYLRQELHGLLESADKSHIPEMHAYIKEIGGYFKRFKGGLLSPWVNPSSEDAGAMDLHARATLTFFEVDRNLEAEAAAKVCGSTASIAVLHSLDAPSTPFFSAKMMALTVAHVGDTRVLLCSTHGGIAHAMTENHRAEGRVESVRLRQMMGTGVIADSFGDARYVHYVPQDLPTLITSRWMGALENTRSLGDLKWKPWGVTAEPEVNTKLIEGSKWAFMVLVSDGISSVVSDQEIVDLARGATAPKHAANRILSFAEEMGSSDNLTAIVLPFAGWGQISGPDQTKKLREYRSGQMIGAERQRRM